MAVMIIIACILAFIAVGIGSMVLFPVLSHLESSEMYTALLPKYQEGVQRVLIMGTATPAVLSGIIFIWAYMRSGKNDHGY